MANSPKLFVSYSWTSEEHAQWVLDFATALRETGVDVILDKWDLKEGHDAYHFMEQMVSDPDVRKVVIVSDRRYAEKADQRSGGVGTETQIISPEVYAAQQQDKFVAVITQRDDNGRPYLPTYYKSRIYIDLSNNDTYATSFEQLLRWIYDKPLFVKPPVGPSPAFLNETQGPLLATAFTFQRASDAIRNNRAHRAGAVGEYLDRLAGGFPSLRMKTADGEFDDHVVQSIDQFLPYRNEAIGVFLGLAQHGPLPDELRSLHRFFEQVYPFMHRPPDVMSYREWDFDNFRFIVHELLLYAVAGLLRYERFDAVAQLVREPYYVGRDGHIESGAASFAAFWENIKSLQHRNDRLGLRRASLRADLLKSRAATSGLSFEHLMQADFTLFLRNAVEALRGGERQSWWPDTLLYADNRPLEIFARAQSRAYFELLKCILEVREKDELETLFKAFNERRLFLPQWTFATVNPATLLGWDRLATRP